MKQRTKSVKQNLSIQETLCRPRKKSTSKNDQKSKASNQSFVKPPNNHINQDQQAKKYLQKTLNILSHRFNLRQTQPIHKQSSIVGLSKHLYKLVKQNIQTSDYKTFIQDQENIHPNILLAKLSNKQTQSKIKDQILKTTFISNRHEQQNCKKNNNKDPRKAIISQKEPNKNRPNSANYSILEASSICHQSSMIAVPGPHLGSQNNIFVKRRSNSTLDSYFRQKFGSNDQDQQAVEKKLRVIKALKKSQQIVSKSNRSHVQSSIGLASCDKNEKSIVMEKLKNKCSQSAK